MESDVLQTLRTVIQAFEEMGIAYHIGGSIASSIHGIYRLTADVDLIADMTPAQASKFAQLLESQFYVDEEMILSAIEHRSSFNVIDDATGNKVDVFILKLDAYDQQAFFRSGVETVEEGEDAPAYFIASAEDTILNKLRWYRMGGELSERQWLDVQGVLKVQAENLEFDYLRIWAAEIGVADLLDRAILVAGIAH